VHQIRHRALVLAALCLFACGRLGFDPLGTEDGGLVDGDGTPIGDDALIVDAGPSGSATVKLVGVLGPLQGVPVIFHDSEGTVVDVVISDDSGTAQAIIGPGAMVTLADSGVEFSVSFGGETKLYTVTGVNPGDTITFGVDSDPWQTVAQINVSLPGAFAGASLYAVSVGCGEASTSEPGTPIALEVPAACVRAGNLIDLLVIALDDGENILGYTSAVGFPINLGGVVGVNPPAWSTGMASTSLNLTNAPPSSTGAETKFGLVSGVGEFIVDHSNGSFVGNSLALPHSYPLGFASGLRYLLCVFHSSGTQAENVSYILRRITGNVPSTIGHDLAIDVLAIISSALLGINTPSRPSVSFTVEDGDLATADGGIVVVQWMDGGGGTFEWAIMIAPGTTIVTVPALPDLIGDLRPTAQSQYLPPRVAIFDADFIDNYDVFRTVFGFNFVLSQVGTPNGDFTVRAASGPNGFF